MGDTQPGVLGSDPPVGARGGNASSPPGAARAVPGPTGASAQAAAGLQMGGWPRRVRWDEFRELDRRPEGVQEDAEIHSEGSGDNNMTVVPDGGQFRIGSIKIEMTVEQDSWVVKGQQSDYLLNHEQGHFDITGLLWRDLAKAILGLRAGSVRELGRQVNRTKERFVPIFERMTKQYDEETKHSLDRDMQKKWDEKLQLAMKTGGPLR